MEVKLLSSQARLPVRATKCSAGFDLFSAERVLLPAQARGLIKTDIAIRLPEGHHGRVAPHSCLSIKNIDIGSGVIDEDYRGSIGVLMINNSSGHYQVEVGERIASPPYFFLIFFTSNQFTFPC